MYCIQEILYSPSFLVVLGKIKFFKCTKFSNKSLVLTLQHCHPVFQAPYILFFLSPAFTSCFPETYIHVGAWRELACHKRHFFTHPPRFLMPGTWCPIYLCVCVSVLFVEFLTWVEGDLGFLVCYIYTQLFFVMQETAMCFPPVFHETYLSFLSLLIWHCLATQVRLAWTAGQGTRVHTQHGWMAFGVRKKPEEIRM